MAELTGKEILVTWQRCFCPAHGEHFRTKDDPATMMVAGMQLVKFALASPSLIKAVDSTWNGEDRTANMDVAVLNRITDLRPFCYFVTREQMRLVLMAAELALVGTCDGCGRGGMGGPYQISTAHGIVEQWVCFECACDAGERLHRAHPNGKVWPQGPR